MSNPNKHKMVAEQLINKEISMEEFVKEHMNPTSQGQMIQIYETSSVQSLINGSKVTTKYNTLCLKLSDGKHYSARRISFTNQLCSGNAKCQKADVGKESKYVILRFREFTREEIASGDYVMPKTDGMSEQEVAALTAKYDKNIDDLVNANQLLKAFHIALENEWQAFSHRLKNTFDENGKPTVITLAADKIVRHTILSTVEVEEKGITVIKEITPPRYTWKIPVFIPHTKTSERAKVFKYRLGQVFMNSDDKFEPAVCDMDASKEASKNGKKNLVEARLKGVRNGQPCEEVLTCFNVGKYITRKSRMGGYLDISQSTISGLGGHSLKILAPHLIVKRHKTTEKESGLSDENLDTLYGGDDGFDRMEDTGINFDETDFKTPAGQTGQVGQVQQVQRTQAYSGDVSQLDAMPLNQFNTMNLSAQPQMQNMQQMPPQNMQPVHYQQQYQHMQAPQPMQNAPLQYQNMQAPPVQPMQQPMQYPPNQGMPNPNYAALVNNGLARTG